MQIKDNEFVVGLTGPTTATVTCRTGKYLDAVIHADTPQNAIIRAYEYTAAVLDGRLHATRAAMQKALTT